jgi:hypothetical protein
MSGPRPGNSGRADYPRMLYHGDGRTVVVATPKEHDDLLKAGWDSVPQSVHMRPAPSPAPIMAGGDPMGAMIRQILNEVLDERGLGTPTPKRS